MFFFFFGGLQPKIKQVLKANYGPCLNCHNGFMDEVELAQTLYAFFLPLYSFDSKRVLYCKDCGLTVEPENYQRLQQQGTTWAKPPEAAVSRFCPKCGASVDGGWTFCPKCGDRL